LCDIDLAQWAEENAELLRSGRFAEADIQPVAEDIEGLTKNERRSLRSRFMRLIEHLLKWQFQPEPRGRSWELTPVDQRRGIKRLLKENPSFRPTISTFIAEAYDDAVARLMVIIGRPKKDFPETYPYPTDQLLDEDFLP